jgi:hypothetical protein
MHIVKHLRHVADAASYSRKTTLVKGGHNPRTGEVWEARPRKRAVNRRVRRFRNRNGYGFLVVNDGLSVIADISRLIGYYAADGVGVGFPLAHEDRDDFFGPAPDHAPAGGVGLHDDFDRAGSAVAQEIRHAKLDHAFSDGVAADTAGRWNKGKPVPARADGESDVSGHNFVSFVYDNCVPF